MPLGEGFWYNRRTNRFITINDHAKDVCANPERFGLTTEDLIKVVSANGREWTQSQGHVVVKSEEDRDLIIPRVCQAGFIRIRHWGGRLGWQFAGDPINALEVLRRKQVSLGFGPMTIVTFTDFGLGLSVTDTFTMFQKGSESKPLVGLLDTWVKRYEVTKQRSCPKCDGCGRIDAFISHGGIIACPDCNGTGKVKV